MTTDRTPPALTPEQQRDVDAALLAYWTSRDEARAAQEARGVVDVGGRAGVTSGGHLDRLAQLFGRACVAAGAPPSQVYYKAPKDDPAARKGVSTGFTLPGYFRPTKQWDLVVYHEAKPIVAIEFKSQNGPSFGNNANNRVEEAIGSAFDLRKAIEAGTIPSTPWMGYVFIIEAAADSQKNSADIDRLLLAKEELFSSWSYTSRVRILCQRVVEQGLYDSAWALTSMRPPNFSWSDLDPPVSGYSQFVTAMATHVSSFYPNGPGADVPVTPPPRHRKKTPAPDDMDPMF